MRRIATILGTLAASAALALTVPASAQAAEGELYLNGVPYADPRGCTEAAFSSEIENFTNESVYLYDGPLCSGRMVREIYPGQSSYTYGSASIYVP